jgi:hypothetical protein
LDQLDSSGGGKKRSNCGSILKDKPTRLVSREYMLHENKKENKQKKS